MSPGKHTPSGTADSALMVDTEGTERLSQTCGNGIKKYDLRGRKLEDTNQKRCRNDGRKLVKSKAQTSIQENQGPSNLSVTPQRTSFYTPTGHFIRYSQRTEPLLPSDLP